MRIAYIADVNIHQHRGVFGKLKSIHNSFNDLGISSQFFILSKGSPIQEDNFQFLSLGQNHSRYAANFRKWISAGKLLSSVSIFNPDVLYTRDTLFSPAFLSPTRKWPYFVEINTNASAEYRAEDKLKWLYYLATRNFTYGRATGFFFVGRSISELPYFRKLGKPFLVMPNGIDTKQYPALPMPVGTKPNLLFIGTPGQPWHGIDKIVYLAEQCPKFQFHIIGDSIPSRHNLISYGFLREHGEIEKILRLCHLGIATLSLYEKNMIETSAIKSRLYLASGLPMIIGHEDPDLNSDLPFVLRLPCHKDNVSSNLERIRDFTLKCVSNPSLRISARMFAENQLDTRRKERIRLDFVRTHLPTAQKT